MIKSKPWAQLEYEYAYRLFRRGFSYKKLWDSGEHCLRILKADDYSYQAYGYEPNGWVSDLRRKRFHAIKYRFASREELPF